MEFQRLLQVIVGCVLVVSCYSCYTKYQQCYQTFSSVPAPVNNDMTAYCKAADKGMKCLKDDAKDCPESKPVPEIYSNFKIAIGNIQVSCEQAKCGLKQQDCSKQSLAAYNMVSKDGNLPKSDVPKFCSSMDSAFKCYANLKEKCPSIKEAMAQSEKQFQSFRSRYCQDYDNGVSASVSSMIMMVLGILAAAVF